RAGALPMARSRRCCLLSSSLFFSLGDGDGLSPCPPPCREGERSRDARSIGEEYRLWKTRTPHIKFPPPFREGRWPSGEMGDRRLYGTADQGDCGEDEGSADDNLNRGEDELRAEILCADERNHDQLDANDEICTNERNMDVWNKKGKCVPHAA